jgi:hypothetical protein
MRQVSSRTVAFVAILCSIACTAKERPAEGLRVDVAMAPGSCGDGRDVVAAAVGKHKAKLNGAADVSIGELKLQLHKVLSYRAEKLVYVTADADVSWGEFVELVDGVWPEADVVSLITPRVKAMAARTYCLAPSCGQCAALRSLHSRQISAPGK